MDEWLISGMFAAGASTWVYVKLQRTSGNNTKQSVIATAFIGLIIFFVGYSILSLTF